MATVSALVSGLDAELRRLGYKDSTMVWYRGCWRRMERFFAARGVEEFSLDVAMAWVDEACGFFDKERAGTLKPNDVYLFRVAQMLGDYAVHGAVLRRYSRSVSKLAGEGADAVVRFQAWLRAADRAASTVRTYGTVAGEFVAFVGTRGGLARCDAGDGRGVRRHAWRDTRSRRSSRNCARCGPSSGSPPPMAWSTPPSWTRSRRCAPASRPGSRRCGIPARWPGSWTRSTGATRAGSGTTRSFCWSPGSGCAASTSNGWSSPTSTGRATGCSVVQAKTGHRVQLPLLKEVGWAVIDYIRHGRPVCDCPQVFLRHTAPIGPFSDQDHLHQILVKHARAAHVPVSEKRRHGMHSLQAHPGDPVDGGRHTGRADRRHPRPPVGQIDRRVSEVVAGSAGQVRPGPGRAGAGGVTMSPEHHAWPTRSRRWSRRNAPSATSTPPKSGCWPGSPRSAAAEFPGLARA